MRIQAYAIGLLAALLLTMGLAGCGNRESQADSQPGAEPETAQVYLAGPFFNEEEIKNVEYVESILDAHGFSYFSPIRHSAEAEPGTAEWSDQIFEMDKNELGKADFVVALYYGSNSDSGTAWECGYASAKGVPVILVHVYRDGDSNLMMHSGCTTNVYLEDLAEYDFVTMPVYEYDGRMY